MNSPARTVELPPEAVLALSEILGIMSDQLLDGMMTQRWDAEHIVELQLRLNDAHSEGSVELVIEDAALLLDGMAFTEMMSVEFPFFDMVQWTSDFITSEIRRHWSEDEWRDHVAR